MESKTDTDLKKYRDETELILKFLFMIIANMREHENIKEYCDFDDHFQNILSAIKLLIGRKDIYSFLSNRKESSINNIQKQKEAFIDKYRITRMDELLLSKIIDGVPLKCFKDEMNISASNANKKIRRLWQRLGLENREQLLFVSGWMRLINFKTECLIRADDGCVQ